MAKRLRADLIEESIITLHFAAPVTPQEAEALEVLKGANGVEYRKTVERTSLIAKWYESEKLLKTILPMLQVVSNSMAELYGAKSPSLEDAITYIEAWKTTQGK